MQKYASVRCSHFSLLICLWFPKMFAHIHMTIRLKSDALLFQQCPLTRPAWSRAPCDIHHPMTRQFLSPRRARPLVACYRRDARIPQRPSHHPRMTRPSRPRSDMSVGHHLPTRNLADDIQYILAKRSRLLRRHLIGVVTHLSCYYIVLANKVTNNLAQIPLLAYFSPQKLLDLKSFRIVLWCTGSNNGRPAAATA